jgi:RES domain-containing protein
VISWRLTKRGYSSRTQVLGGEGARVGGRWNRAGLPLVYSSENSSLALLETLVRTSDRRLPKSLVAVRISIPDDASVRTVAIRDLPSSWREVDNLQSSAIGSHWIESRASLVLRVPSAVNSLEENVLLNPLHSAIDTCEVGEPVPILVDLRMISIL